MKIHVKILFPALLPFVFLCFAAAGRNIARDFQTMQADTSVKAKARVDSFRLQIIPPSSGVQFYKDKIVFLSMAKNERKMTPNQISFGVVEAYFANIEDSVTGRHSEFLPGYSFTYPCDGMSFSPDYSTIYFSKIASDKKEKIYTAKISVSAGNQPNLATEPVMLDFCKANSSYTHPALSADGNTMIYASDTKGTAGGMDLYISHQVNGKWSEPENMGKGLNTSGNEYSPFLDSENNLYFSSDKLPGHGGYDIFTCKFNGAGWDQPINLDYINSAGDDIAFTMNKSDANTAFISRKSNGNIQLFKVTLTSKSKEQNLIALFNGKPSINKEENKIAEKEPLAEPAKKEAETKPKPKETEKRKEVATAAKVSAATAQKDNKPAPANAVVIKPTLPLPDAQKDVVIYRIQILTSQKPMREKDIVMNGEHYTLYEYYYLNAYRYSIGEFRTLPPAVNLQKLCRQSGYAQAFVAGFKNNLRSVDLKSFK